MNRSETIASLAAALSRAQAAIQPALKDATNPAFRSHYATLESVVEACRDSLARNDLAVLQFPCDHEAADRVALRTMLLHKSGEFVEETVSTRITKCDPQGVGSALTYLRRYSLASIVGVTTTEDDDGNAASQAQPARVNKAAAQPAPAASADDFPITVVAVLKHCKSTDSVSAAGKPYTRTEIGWVDSDGTKIKGSTFSKSVAAAAAKAHADGTETRVKFKRGERGIDIISVEPNESAVEAVGGADGIPF